MAVYLPVSPRREPLHASGALIFKATTQGMPFDHLALEDKGSLSSWFHGAIKIKETAFGWLLPLRHCTDSRLKHSVSVTLSLPSVSVKEVHLFVQEHWPERQVSGLTHV